MKHSSGISTKWDKHGLWWGNQRYELGFQWRVDWKRNYRFPLSQFWDWKHLVLTQAYTKSSQLRTINPPETLLDPLHPDDWHDLICVSSGGNKTNQRWWKPVKKAILFYITSGRVSMTPSVSWNSFHSMVSSTANFWTSDRRCPQGKNGGPGLSWGSLCRSWTPGILYGDDVEPTEHCHRSLTWRMAMMMTSWYEDWYDGDNGY